MAEVSAPCGFTLFGYDMAMYKGTSVAVALEQGVECRSRVDKHFTVNGEKLDSKKHPYMRAVIIHGWSDIDTPVALDIGELEYPKNAVGYIAANVASSLSALSMLYDRLLFDDIALKGYKVLSSIEPDAGPMGTSAAVHGSGVMSTRKKRGEVLWRMKKGNSKWHIQHLDVPDMIFVIGFPPDGGACADALHDRVCLSIRRQKSFAQDILKDAGKLAEKGVAALEDSDLKKVGNLMEQTDKLSAIVGMHREALKPIAGAARRRSYGVMMSSAAKSGCAIALTDEPDEVVKSIEDAGGLAIIAKTSKKGIRV